METIKLKFLAIVISISFSTMAQTWQQQGNDINGEFKQDSSGRSISLSGDGSIVAIGAPFNNNSFGHVRVYSFNKNAGSWEQLGSDIDGEFSRDRSGNAISLSSNGNIIAIGASGNNDNGNNGFLTGHVRMYNFNASLGDWEQLGNDIDGESERDESGRSISLSSDGTIVAIGAPGNNSSSGHVRVYSYNGNWVQLGSDIDGESEGDRLGSSVSLSNDGNVVAIGAPFKKNEDNGLITGHVQVYNFNSGLGNWELMGNEILNETKDDIFGSSVSLNNNGTILAIGAPGNWGNNRNKNGFVRTYSFNSTSRNWEQLGNEIEGEAEGDQFGFSLSLNKEGNILAVGSPDLSDPSVADSGRVRVYTFDEVANMWIQIGNAIKGDSFLDSLGTSIDLSDDGTVIAVGTPRGNNDAGHARVFQFVDATLSIDENLLSIESFKVFPNPTLEELKINTPEIIIKQVFIYNYKGTLVFSKAFNDNAVDISMANLQTGTYMVNIRTDSGQISKKIVKK